MKGAPTHTGSAMPTSRPHGRQHDHHPGHHEPIAAGVLYPA